MLWYWNLFTCQSKCLSYLILWEQIIKSCLHSTQVGRPKISPPVLHSSSEQPHLPSPATSAAWCGTSSVQSWQCIKRELKLSRANSPHENILVHFYFELRTTVNTKEVGESLKWSWGVDNIRAVLKNSGCCLHDHFFKPDHFCNNQNQSFCCK